MKGLTRTTLIIFLFLALCFPYSYCGPREEKEKFQVALGAFSDEFYQASLSLFERFVKEFPESDFIPQVKLYIAKCLFYKKNYSQSLSRLKELEKRGYSGLIPQIDYWMAKIFFQKEDFKSCLSRLKKINKTNAPRYYQKAEYLKASAYLKSGRAKKAKAGFKKLTGEASSQSLSDKSYQNLLRIYSQENNFHQISTSAKEYLKNNPGTGIKDQIYFYLADAHRKKEYFKKAAGYYQSALNLTTNPGLRDLAYRGLGLAYLNQAKPALAKRTIDKIADNQLRLFAQGQYYLKNGDLIQALESFSSYIQKYPQGKFLPRAYLKKADILYETGRINDSLSIYNQILEAFDQHQYAGVRNNAHYGLAWCYLKNSNFKKAVAEFKKTLQHSSDPAVKISSQIQMADAYQESNRYQKALDIYNEILNNHPNTLYADYIQFQIGMIFIKTKQLEQAFLSFRNLTQNFPDSKLIPEAEYYLAVGYFSQNKYRQAQEMLNKLLSRYPDAEITPEAEYLRAKCLFNQEQYTRALEILRKIIRRHKNLAVAEFAYIDAGLAYLNLQQFNKAKELWKEFLKAYPNSEYKSSVTSYLAGIYEKENDFARAEKYYQQALAVNDPISSQEALLSLGHLAWNQGNLEKAAAYFKKGAEKETSLGLKSKLYLAKIYQQQNKTEKSLDIYNRLIDSQSEIAKAALLSKAFLLKDLKKYREAIEVFMQAADRGYSSLTAKFALGICYEKTNSLQKAVRQYFNIVYSQPGPETGRAKPDYRVKSYFRIAKIYEKQNNLREARKIYEKIIGLEIQESKIAKARLKKIGKDND